MLPHRQRIVYFIFRAFSGDGDDQVAVPFCVDIPDVLPSFLFEPWRFVGGVVKVDPENGLVAGKVSKLWMSEAELVPLIIRNALRRSKRLSPGYWIYLAPCLGKVINRNIGIYCL